VTIPDFVDSDAARMVRGTHAFGLIVQRAVELVHGMQGSGDRVAQHVRHGRAMHTAKGPTARMGAGRSGR
jgi:hypothetical protein